MDDKDIIPIETLPGGESFPISIDSVIYARLQNLILEGLPFKGKAHFDECIAQAKTGKTTDPVAYHLHTILYLINLIENSARENNKITKRKFNLITKSMVD